METSLGPQLGPSHTHPGPADAATNGGSLCSSQQVAQSWSQVAPDIDLHWSPFEGAPEQTHPEASFTPHQSVTQSAPQSAHSSEPTTRGHVPNHTTKLV